LAGIPVAVTVATLALVALVFVTFVELVFAAVLAAVGLVALALAAAALAGTALFGRAPFLAAEVAFFTAMLGPFKMALRSPNETGTCVRENKAIRRSSQWRNAALGSVSQQQNPGKPSTSRSR
jgi:hypothetical protein